ncbi:MAG: RHS repeat protein, partial [Proteobacteria bacterium]|nr:RHS repeat protein [Pseudomonadota bacterium]
LETSVDDNNDARTIEVTDTVGGRVISYETAGGRVGTFEVRVDEDGSSHRIRTSPDGTVDEIVQNTDGSTTQIGADGVEMTWMAQEADDAWNTRINPGSSMTLTTPGGLTQTMETTVSRTLGVATDPFSTTETVHTAIVNGTRTYSTTWQTITGDPDVAVASLTELTPAGRTSTWFHDEFGRMLRMEEPTLSTIWTTRDSQGRVTGYLNGTRETTFAFDSRNNMETMTNAAGDLITFEYDLVGRMTAFYAQDNERTEFVYDERGQLTEFTPPGQPKWKFSHTVLGQVHEVTAPDVGAGPDVTSFTWDADDNLLSVDFPTGDTVDNVYDVTTGRIDEIKLNGTAVTNYTYDSAGRVSQLETYKTTQTYVWDGSLPLSTTWAGEVSGVVSYTFGNEMLPTEQKINGAHALAYGYDDDLLLESIGDLSFGLDAATGTIASATLGDVVESYGINDHEEWLTLAADWQTTSLYEATITRDALGRIDSMVEVVEGNPATHEFEYDGRGRLLSWDVDGAVTAYTWDANSNLATVAGGPASVVDGRDQLES